MRAEAIRHYGLTEGKKYLLIVGGSLGCRTLNESVTGWIEAGCPGGGDIEIIWQCGRYYKADMDKFMEKARLKTPGGLPFIHNSDFISRMDLAYAAADVVVSRSGASSISELCAAHKASIFVPSPNVTEDHQTHNAMALVRKDAAMMVSDAKAREELMETACSLIADTEKTAMLEKNIALLAKADAADAIAEEIYKLV